MSRQLEVFPGKKKPKKLISDAIEVDRQLSFSITKEVVERLGVRTPIKYKLLKIK